MKRIDKVMEAGKNCAQSTREMCEDIKLEDLSQNKMIKREENKADVFLRKKCSRNKMKGLIFKEHIRWRPEELN